MNQNDALLDELYAGTAMSRHTDIVQCHFCHGDLHVDNNSMTRCMDGKELAERGFGWISIIVAPFSEVPCCDICFDTAQQQPDFVMA